MKRSPLRRMSNKKRRTIAARTAIVRTTCELAGYTACYGPIDRHEIVRRSQDSTAAVTPELVIGLCRRHHALDEHKGTAVMLGIRIDPHQWRLADERERAAMIADAAGLRALARRGIGGAA